MSAVSSTVVDNLPVVIVGKSMTSRTILGETRPLEAEQPQRLQKMIAIFKRYAEEKGLVPVADDWSPWSTL
jgi:hypothetical protein